MTNYARRGLTLAALAVVALVAAAVLASLAEQHGSWVLGSGSAGLVVLAFTLAFASNREAG